MMHYPSKVGAALCQDYHLRPIADGRHDEVIAGRRRR
jgi:hypothetical protein